MGGWVAGTTRLTPGRGWAAGHNTAYDIRCGVGGWGAAGQLIALHGVVCEQKRWRHAETGFTHTIWQTALK